MNQTPGNHPWIYVQVLVVPRYIFCQIFLSYLQRETVYFLAKVINMFVQTGILQPFVWLVSTNHIFTSKYLKTKLLQSIVQFCKSQSRAVTQFYTPKPISTTKPLSTTSWQHPMSIHEKEYVGESDQSEAECSASEGY